MIYITYIIIISHYQHKIHIQIIIESLLTNMHKTSITSH